MKHWYRTLAAKIVCFILCVTFLVITAASVVGASFMIMGEFYTLPKEYVVSSSYESMLRSESNNIIWHYLGDSEYHYYTTYDYSPDMTNVRYSVEDPEGKLLGANCDASDFDYCIKWVFYKDKDGNLTEIDYYYDGIKIDENTDIYTVNMSVDKSFPVKDQYFLTSILFDIVYALLYWIYPIGIISLFLTVATFVLLMCASGRRAGTDGLFPGPLYKVPIDLLCAFLVFIFTLLLFLITDEWYTGDVLMWVLIGITVLAAVNAFIGLCMSISVRIKGKTLFSNTLIWIVLRIIGKLFKWTFKGIVSLICAIPIIWRTFLFVAVNLFLDIILLFMADVWLETALPLWIIKTICTVPVIIYSALILRKLQRGGRAIAKGDMTYRIDTRGMLLDFRRHGEDLNSISSGMALAVEERLKSERMKTELITNVSHDIKTPITSIINYSSLIAKEECNCEKHREYSEVLVRKSEHLKRLLDDLVEASKATTGNLDISLEPCDGAVLISQAAGEYLERCRDADLELICDTPSAPIMIMADQRRIWRIFENLLSNACKYSLPHSRVYLSVKTVGKCAVFTIKNTSLSPLNISPDELTQRFVRGDTSRTTEGNGLGLSIAKSLTELQGGAMNITIDGDLFKVELTFSLI